MLAVVVKYLERPRDARNFTRTYELSQQCPLAHGRAGATVAGRAGRAVGDAAGERRAADLDELVGRHVSVHIVNYAGREARERLNDLQDTGTITVIVQLMEVA